MGAPAGYGRKKGKKGLHALFDIDKSGRGRSGLDGNNRSEVSAMHKPAYSVAHLDKVNVYTPYESWTLDLQDHFVEYACLYKRSG
mgnify:FL=1